MTTNPDSTDETDDLDDGWNVDDGAASSLSLGTSLAPASTAPLSVPPASAAEDTDELDAGWETDSEREPALPGAPEAKKRWPRRERRRKDPAALDRSPARVVKPAPSQEPSLKKARRELDRKRRDQEAAARAEREAARKAEREQERKARLEARPSAPAQERRPRKERHESERRDAKPQRREGKPSRRDAKPERRAAKPERVDDDADRSDRTDERTAAKPARSRGRRESARSSASDDALPKRGADAKRWIGGALTLLAVALIGLVAWRLSR